MFTYFEAAFSSTKNLLELERAELERALNAFHTEIGGKLIYVHVLPGLSEDGVLYSSFKSKGLCIKKEINYLNKDEEASDFCELLSGEGLATIHFSLNKHVDACHYKDRPFVVLIPANSDLLLQTTSMSFTETIILGDYKLPSDAVVMVRESKKHLVPDYYNKNHKVVVFNDEVITEINLDQEHNHHAVEVCYDFNKKMTAVDNVIAELGGAKLNMLGNFWFGLKAIDNSGRNINTPEVFKKLFGKRPVSFGTHEYTRQDSSGEQWRDFYTTTSSSLHIIFRGDVSFSIEAYHSVKLNNWLNQLLIPTPFLQEHLKRNKYNLIALRAMDFIFDHFKEKKLARAYISHHVKKRLEELEKSGSFNVESGLFTAPLLETKTVDQLAKMICDYDHLKNQERGETFDLITSQQMMSHLIVHLLPMHPIEARSFLITYFQKSNFVAEFSQDERYNMLQKLQNMYVLLYSNCPYVSEQMFKSYAPILSEMHDKDFRIDKSLEDEDWCMTVLGHVHLWNITVLKENTMTEELLKGMLQYYFDKAITRLNAASAPKVEQIIESEHNLKEQIQKIVSTRSALIFSVIAAGALSAAPYVIEYTQTACGRYRNQLA